MRSLHAFVALIISTIIIASIIIVAPQTNAANEPNVFISTSEIAAVKAQVQAGNEPWKSSYNRILSDANAALNKGPYNVTRNGGPNSGHDYRTELPYCGWKRVDGKDPDCRDGQINPQADRKDYEAAISFGAAVRDLGLAYAFTNDERYAQRAAYLIRVWAVDSSTRMTPKYTDNQSRIELSITMPGVFYGADLIRGSSSWPQNEQAAFENWVDDFLGTSRWTATNNFDLWRLVTISSGGAFLNDQGELNYAFDRYKQILPNHIGQQGQMLQELGRTKSLTYSLYSVNALTQIAEIARHNGVNLYDYTTSGVGLKTALDFHAPFSTDQSSWSRQQIAPIESQDIAYYEMAYNYFGEGRYLSVLQEWGRPVYERRTMGWVTLTHGRLEGGPTVPSPTPPAPTPPPTNTPPPSSDIEITDLTGVSNNASIQGNLTSEAQVSGSGVERVEFKLSGPDGYVYEKMEKHAPYSLAGDENNGQTLKSLDTTTMPNGAYTLTATAFSPNGNAERVEQFVVQNGNDGGGNDRIAVPGQFEVEDYTAYTDKSPGNNGDSTYRNDDVDLRHCTGNEGGICAGWWDYGESLSYDVQIATGGDYTMVVRGATARDDVKLAVLVDGNEVSRIALANTGDTATFQNNEKTVSLPEGARTLTIQVVSGHSFDLNWLELKGGNSEPQPTATPQQPDPTAEPLPTATPVPSDKIAVPGQFEVEDYADYRDKSPGNNGDSTYRNDDVDLRHCTGNEGGICAGWWDYGESLSYDVQIATGGDYTMVVRGATARDDVKLAVLVDGNEVSRIALANTGDTATFQNNEKTVSLPEGARTLTIQVVSGHSFDLNWLELKSS
ncbi:MAG: hypothetical protein GFH23_1086618n225 [Chloroflexi bacterium AL-N1]|nr:hypothetical protein [Chloroflexi bacterium AL-N1]NOK86834.1 hypothetical protein [Chloroflexi bacterium AL-N15]